MKLFRSCVALLMSCALAICSFAVAAVDRTSTLLTAAKGFALKVFTGPVEIASAPAALPEVRRIQAVAFVQRLIKRERPLLSAGWRMCPST